MHLPPLLTPQAPGPLPLPLRQQLPLLHQELMTLVLILWASSYPCKNFPANGGVHDAEKARLREGQSLAKLAKLRFLYLVGSRASSRLAYYVLPLLLETPSQLVFCPRDRILLRSLCLHLYLVCCRHDSLFFFSLSSALICT